VLGSGSKGNATLVTTPHLHLLIDAGLPPDELERRMDGTGASWKSLDAILLTHTHSDHVRKKCLAYCAANDVQFICHKRHAHSLSGRYLTKVEEAGLLRTYVEDEVIELKPAAATPKGAYAHTPLRIRPVALPHDADPTFGFHIDVHLKPSEEHPQSDERRLRLAYVADCGTANDALMKTLSDVDLLALEFNHDEEMELNSGRPDFLIERVLSDEGHLSNAQAAEVLSHVLKHNGNGGPKFLIQLHLSEECNTERLAYSAAQDVVKATSAQTKIFSSRQHQRGTIHVL
jgi:phosphoribosyl 1,2-cyclic phosphodiesterase